MRRGNSTNRCLGCKEPVRQPATGRTRKFCSEACKQRFYRGRKRLEAGRSKRARKPRPLGKYERATLPGKPVPTMRLSRYGAAYQCGACGKPYYVERLGGGVAPKFCSKRCQKRHKYQRGVLLAAMERARWEGKLDERVAQRVIRGYQCPICPQCKLPFVDEPRRGRKRIYCSDQCRKAAYEKRFAHRVKHKRRHRYATCRVCGERFDRVGEHGKLQRKFCSRHCQTHYASRKYRERKQRERARQAERVRRQKLKRCRQLARHGPVRVPERDW